jgi:hypothetical protein
MIRTGGTAAGSGHGGGELLLHADLPIAGCGRESGVHVLLGLTLEATQIPRPPLRNAAHVESAAEDARGKETIRLVSGHGGVAQPISRALSILHQRGSWRHAAASVLHDEMGWTH